MFKRSKHNKKSIARRTLMASIALLVASCSITVFVTTGHVAAQTPPPATNECKVVDGKIVVDPAKPCIAKDLGKPTGDPAVTSGCKSISCNKLITDYVNPTIKLLSALVGIIVAISIVVAGVLYSSASGDPSKVSAAKDRLTNAVIALLAYLFMMGFLQWLLPGGVL